MPAAAVSVWTRGDQFKAFARFHGLQKGRGSGRRDNVHPCCVANPSLGTCVMNILIWLIVGGVIGWLASILMGTNGQQGIVLNVVVGIIGAMIAGWLISPMVGVGTINQNNFSAPALLVSFGGAVALLAVVSLLRRGSTR